MTAKKGGGGGGGRLALLLLLPGLPLPSYLMTEKKTFRKKTKNRWWKRPGGAEGANEKGCGLSRTTWANGRCREWFGGHLLAGAIDQSGSVVVGDDPQPNDDDY